MHDQQRLHVEQLHVGRLCFCDVQRTRAGLLYVGGVLRRKLLRGHVRRAQLRKRRDFMFERLSVLQSQLPLGQVCTDAMQARLGGVHHQFGLLRRHLHQWRMRCAGMSCRWGDVFDGDGLLHPFVQERCLRLGLERRVHGGLLQDRGPDVRHLRRLLLAHMFERQMRWNLE